MADKQALNLYSVLDNELGRMHDLMKVYLSLPKVEDRFGHGSFNPSAAHVPELFKRIVKIQDLVITAALKVDPELQEKIAELALTGERKP